jgi:hypothetical protein
VQAAGLPNWPLALQVSTPLPEHCVAPGVHEPVHVPMLQTAGQTVPVACQFPFMSQVCGCCPLHCIAPGAHVPLHVPAVHA